MNSIKVVSKKPTGIKGFDLISEGGLPQGRATMILGVAGCGKTLFSAQFLVEGIRQFDETGIFVTFEESPDDIRANIAGFGWDIEQWENENKWKFIDATLDPEQAEHQIGAFDLTGFITRIHYAFQQTQATRIALDSIDSIYNHFQDAGIIRRELLRIFFRLKKLNLTTVITAEQVNDSGRRTRFGVEEFVADNVIQLKNELDGEFRRRTIEILKYRGTSHQNGTFPFSITSNKGIEVIPLTAVELRQKSSGKRITTGNAELDQMCGGGFYHDSIILVSGATGTGKTLLASEYIRGGVTQNEKCLYFAFEESREQIVRNVKGWGGEFDRWEREEKLRFHCQYPEITTLDDHLVKIKNAVLEFQPTRIAIDSLSALERIGSTKGFREFVVSLTSFLKEHSLACMLTSTTPTMTEHQGRWETHISTITDSIILLRYVEMLGFMTRGIVILKMRGSAHDNTIREFLITSDGMQIGKTFQNFSGILAGNPFADSIVVNDTSKQFK